MANKKRDLPKGIALVAFLASMAGIWISIYLLQEDVLSTAHTLFSYFPSKFGVTPATEWSGAITLGWFTTVLQVVTISIAFSSGHFSNRTRWLAGLTFVLACGFDNWTDIVHRSGYLTGNLWVSIVSTFAFYTAGSEVLQGLAWAVFATFWRRAISDVMWGSAVIGAGLQSISDERKRFASLARTQENSNRGLGASPNSAPNTPYRPQTPPNGGRPNGGKPNGGKPNGKGGQNKPNQHQTFKRPIPTSHQNKPNGYGEPEYHPVGMSAGGGNSASSFLSQHIHDGEEYEG